MAGNPCPTARRTSDLPHGSGCWRRAGYGDTDVVGATPELDSLVLFGTGLLGAGGYALTRFRARRRHDEVVDTSSTL